jgi:hypothetical protein
MTATHTTTAATPKKLKDGSWGALAQSESVTPGDTLQVTARSGKSWGATVSKVLWAGDGKAIVSTDSGKGVRDGFCDECGHESEGLKKATDSSGIEGYVCGRCYGPAHMLSFA